MNAALNLISYFFREYEASSARNNDNNTSMDVMKKEFAMVSEKIIVEGFWEIPKSWFK